MRAVRAPRIFRTYRIGFSFSYSICQETLQLSATDIRLMALDVVRIARRQAKLTGLAMPWAAAHAERELVTSTLEHRRNNSVRHAVLFEQ
jgi:hypothetical protein